MLIERFLPASDATRTEHRIVAGDVASAYEAVCSADFMRAWRESTAIRVLFGARAFAERAVSAARRRPVGDAPPPATLRLADLTSHGEWVHAGHGRRRPPRLPALLAAALPLHRRRPARPARRDRR